MMRKWLCTLCALCLLVCGAQAESAVYAEGKLDAQGLLTEVYGYEQAETEAFTYEVEESDGQLLIDFAPTAHPEWRYTAAFSKGTDGSFIASTTPFTSDQERAHYSGESALRTALRNALSLFPQWSAQAQAQVRQCIEKEGMTPFGDWESDMTAAQAVTALFASGYGDRMLWSPAVLAWHAEVLAACGLTDEPMQITQGVRSYGAESYGLPSTITEWNGAPPDVLAQALSHPKLVGWTCLSGALRELHPISDSDSRSRVIGLIGLGRGDERLLVMVVQKAGSPDLQCFPIGEKALMKGRDFSITYDAPESAFTILYPISSVESECFRVRVTFEGNPDMPLCDLIDYRRMNMETFEGVAVSGKRWQSDDDSPWYHVTTYTAGKEAVHELVSAFVPSAFEFIDADAFPKSAEACKAVQSDGLPEGYAVVLGVHLRAKTSSRSADLGDYNTGVIVQLLEVLPGDPSPWAHVRIGSVEGYMSGNYVHGEGLRDMEPNPLEQYAPLRVAVNRKPIALKKGTGWLDGTVTDLPAGTKMHVLATRGDWLHVMVPQGDIGWLMDVNGTDGYVKASDVVQGATALQLDWME